MTHGAPPIPESDLTPDERLDAVAEILLHDVRRLAAERRREKTRRPGLEQILADAEAGRFERVVVRDLARLARSAAQLEQVLGRFEALGVDVVFADAATRIAEHRR
ncbi:MAG: recombinase family protein [Myxococcota bacterium]|nr:recombinase family protein [Myxococcota bacterium]